MRQKGLITITEISPGQTEALRQLLETIGNDIGDNGIIKFHLLKTVHFMRWVILEETVVSGKKISAKLALSTNYDCSLKDHLTDLCGNALSGLTQIYNHCEEAPKFPDTLQMTAYLKRHSRPIAAFYRGTAGRKVSQIHQEQLLWDRTQDFLQKNAVPDEPVAAKKVIVDFLKNDAGLSWAFTLYRPEFTQKFGTATLIFLLVLLLVCWVLGLIWFTKSTIIITGLLLFSIVVWWLQLRRLEKKDEGDFIAARKDPSQVEQLTRKEDYKVQNQLTHLVEVKPGIIRQYTLRFVLWAINLLASFVYNKGQLGGIQSIHYARWVIIDKGKRLLFFSNYDGSWESYLGEFVDRAAVGLTGVWSNTVGFPPTKNLIRQGARNAAEFKAWARKKQIPTQVWYSAYPTLSIKNINNNTAIRQGLSKSQDGKQTKAWLQQL